LFIVVVLQSRSQLLHSRFKPFDVLRDQRERRRTACRKKLINCTSAVRQGDCVQPTDRSQLPPALNGSVPLSRPSSDIAMDDTSPSSQLTHGCNTGQNVGTEWKITDTQSNLKKEITMETLREQTASVTCDRYVCLVVFMSTS